jgi:hypothetical protein
MHGCDGFFDAEARRRGGSKSKPEIREGAEIPSSPGGCEVSGRRIADVSRRLCVSASKAGSMQDRRPR